jgi:hypothetical protein
MKGFWRAPKNIKTKLIIELINGSRLLSVGEFFAHLGVEFYLLEFFFISR